MDTIRLHDKTFRRSISCEQLQKAIAEVAARINSDYREKRTPLFVGVLNGSFMFMGELLRHISFDCEVSFVKIASYSGTATTGRVRELIGLSQDIRSRHVILVEDIVDTGASIEYMTGVLKKQGRVLHSTKHDGQGIGLVSVETAVHRYHGNLTVETGGNVFRANVLLNL